MLICHYLPLVPNMDERLLIVDDDESVLRMVVRWARSCGYVVSTASSAGEALNVTVSGSVDLVVTDLRMPGSDGLELARQLLAQDPDRPVIMMTGYADLGSAREAISAGIYEYLVKPFDLADLSRAVQRALEYRELRLDNRNYQTDLERQVAERTRELGGLNEELRKEVETRRKAEEAHRLAARRSRQEHKMLLEVIESLNHPFYVINADSYAVELANSASGFARTPGGATCHVLNHDRQLPCAGEEGYPCPVEEVKSTKQASRAEHVHRGKDGEDRHVEISSHPIFGSSGEVCRVLQYCVDVTERKHMEHRLRQQQIRALEVDRLHSLGEMAAGVAHELNQPLNGIRAFSEGMLYGMRNGWDTPQEEIRDTLDEIVNQVDRMTDIIDHMRDFARDRSEADPIRFHISEVVRDTLKLVGAQLKLHGVKVFVSIPEDLPACEGWPRSLEQVFLNLVSNARDALGQRAQEAKLGGQGISPSWRPKLEITAQRVDACIRIAFRDTGGGLSPDVARRAFDPFYTTKEVGKGTGLGLSISQNLVAQHGGKLTLENRPGEGSVFIIELPLPGDGAA